jgi:hypothetical protein
MQLKEHDSQRGKNKSTGLIRTSINYIVVVFLITQLREKAVLQRLHCDKGKNTFEVLTEPKKESVC